MSRKPPPRQRHLGLNRVDTVYTSLIRRQPVADVTAAVSEADEAVDVLWAHAGPADRLEHAGGRTEPDRLDLLLFFLPPGSDDQDDSAEQRTAALLHRAHRASPLLRHRSRRRSPPPPA